MAGVFVLPSAAWTEPPGANVQLLGLTPYRTADGYWVLLSAGSMPPTGAVAGGVVQGTDYNTFQTAVTGRRIRRALGGMVFFR